MKFILLNILVLIIPILNSCSISNVKNIKTHMSTKIDSIYLNSYKTNWKYGKIDEINNKYKISTHTKFDKNWKIEFIVDSSFQIIDIQYFIPGFD